MTNKQIIWYKTPAESWLEAFPSGNGRQGVMVYGILSDEKLSLSESTTWSGREEPENDNPRGPYYLPAIQQALLPPRADEKTLDDLMDAFQGKMENYGTSRPFGDLFIHFKDYSIEPTDCSGYRRSLDFCTGVATTEYSMGQTRYQRELFTSHPAQVIVMKISSEQKGVVGFHAEIGPVSIKGGTGTMSGEKDGFVYDGQVFDGAMNIHARLCVKHQGGVLHTDSQGVVLEGADEAVIYLAMATTFRGNDPVAQCQEQIRLAIDKGYDSLKNEHIEDFKSCFNRLQLKIGDSIETMALPLNERITRAKQGFADPGLDVLWFQYARYLTISASRADSPLPMHLQGIWNDNLAANMCWTCDYHLDINSQMNQWIATPGNLPEGNIPLGNYLKDILVPSGRRTARVQYGKQGWVAHTLANAWGYSSVINQVFSVFPTAGAWIAASLWDQFDFFRDEKYLSEVTYPILKESAEFFLDFLIKYPDSGHFVTAPSCSPEHGKISVMPTADRVILFGLFESVIRASEILAIDELFRQKVRIALSKLPPLEVSPQGQLKEWYEDNDTDGVTGHRHFSHLLALFPYDQITAEETPELLKAAEISMDRRTHTKNWEETEFTGANLAAFYARMKKGDAAYKRISIVRDRLTAKNLMTFSPGGLAGAPTDIFIIDGNMGIAAAMAEMLLQSYKDRLELLPALPAHWSSGTVRGLAARGNFTVEMEWSDYVIREAIIHSGSGNLCTIVINTAIYDGHIQLSHINGDYPNEPVLFVKTENRRIKFQTVKGGQYRITGSRPV